VGYLRKKVADDHYSADQVIFAPFGDDPLLISQVTIANHGRASAEIRWVEYWGCQVYQFSYRSHMQASIQGDGGVGGGPWGKRLISDVNSGIALPITFAGWETRLGFSRRSSSQDRSAEDEHAWQEVLSQLASQWYGWFIEPAKDMPLKSRWRIWLLRRLFCFPWMGRRTALRRTGRLSLGPAV